MAEPSPSQSARLNRAAIQKHIRTISASLRALPPDHPTVTAHLLTRSTLYLSLHRSSSSSSSSSSSASSPSVASSSFADGALSDARHLVHAVPHLPAAWLQLFSACVALKRDDDARLALSAAVEFCPFDASLALIRRHYLPTPSPPSTTPADASEFVENALSKGRDALLLGAHEEAARCLDLVLDDERPSLPAAKRQAALSARADARLALAADERETPQRRADWLDAGVADATSLAAEFPAAPDGWLTLACAHAAAGRSKRAVSVLRAACDARGPPSLRPAARAHVDTNRASQREAEGRTVTATTPNGERRRREKHRQKEKEHIRSLRKMEHRLRENQIDFREAPDEQEQLELEWQRKKKKVAARGATEERHAAQYTGKRRETRDSTESHREEEQEVDMNVDHPVRSRSSRSSSRRARRREEVDQREAEDEEEGVDLDPAVDYAEVLAELVRGAEVMACDAEPEARVEETLLREAAVGDAGDEADMGRVVEEKRNQQEREGDTETELEEEEEGEDGEEEEPRSLSLVNVIQDEHEEGKDVPSFIGDELRDRTNGVDADTPNSSNSAARNSSDNITGNNIAPPRTESDNNIDSNMNSSTPTLKLYDLLQVPPTATEAQIKKSYYLLARKYHPDKNADDAGATQQFQKLAEAYRVLSDRESRALYDAHGDRGFTKNSVDVIDPSTLFAMVFGSERFEGVIGELSLASMAGAVDDAGDPPSEATLSAIQRRRVGRLAMELVVRLKPWVDGDKKGFIADAHALMKELREASFGTQLLEVVGAAYVRHAAVLRAGRSALSPASLVRRANIRGARMVRQHNAMAAANRVMDKQRRLHDRVMRLGAPSPHPALAQLYMGGGGGNGGNNEQYISEQEARNIAVEMAENAIDMMWKISILDIENTLQDVLRIVLSGRDLAADRPAADRSTTATAQRKGVGGGLRPLQHGQPATSTLEILSERAYGIQAMGRIFLSVAGR